MPDSTVAIAFMSHLRKERAAILAGDFKEIDDLYSSKETIFKDLALQHLSGNELATIQDALEKKINNYFARLLRVFPLPRPACRHCVKSVKA
jgi:hypothetical protein